MKTISALLQNYLNGNRSALSFVAASSQNVTVGSTSNFLFGENSRYTLECWIQSTQTTVGRLIGKRNSGSTWFSLLINYPTANIVGLETSGAHVFGGGTIINDGARHHIVGTKNGTSGSIYVDGILSSSGISEANTDDSSAVLEIGGIPLGQFYNGVMFEVRIYSRALSAIEVAEHFAGVYKNESGRVLWLPFWDGAGTTATDFSGYGNNGTLVNSPTWVTSDLFPADTRQIRTCDLLTITPVGSSAVYYTNFDSDIVYGGNTFLSGDVKFKRGRIKLITGVQVDNLDLELFGDSTNLIGGYGVISACRAGVLDGARVKLDRLYMPDWGVVTLGTVNLFNGLVGTISAGRSAAKIIVLSDLTILNIHMPRNVYQPGCLHTLFDSGCTLVKASFAVTGTVSAGATASGFNSGLTQADGYFTLGTIKFTSGANNALTRSVKSYKNASGAVVLMLPVPVAPANGDTFTIYPGCDKQQSTCSGKFANLVHFRGMPYVPLPETQT